MTTDTNPSPSTAEVPAAAALATVAELPEGTPGLVNAAPAADQAPPPAELGATDRKGNRHDPQVHEVPPRLNCEGLWARRRGNAARRAKGLPMSGSTKGKPAAGDAPPPADIPGQQSFLAVDQVEAAPPSGRVVAAELIPPQTLTPEDYTGTASGLVFSLFGVCRILFGKAWKPEAEESRAWNEAMKRTLAHYQAPVLGPSIELIPLAIDSVARRADDTETKDRAGRIAGWFRRIFGRKQVAESKGAGQTQARQDPQYQAGQSPRAVF